jgi:hypothetical protein
MDHRVLSDEQVKHLVDLQRQSRTAPLLSKP